MTQERDGIVARTLLYVVFGLRARARERRR